MLRHILRQFRRGKLTLSGITQERKAPLFPLRCHAPLPKPLYTAVPARPAPPETPAEIINFPTGLPHRQQTLLNNPRESHSSTVLKTHAALAVPPSFLGA